ncbi:MAG: hypothetical protein AAF420_10535, partial [Pseudomonadota bacterium]
LKLIDLLNRTCTDKGINHRFSYSEAALNAAARKGSLDLYYDRESQRSVYEQLQSDFETFEYSDSLP